MEVILLLGSRIVSMPRKDTLDFLTVFSKSYVDMTKSNSENVLDILRN